jgi:hypothetical protein
MSKPESNTRVRKKSYAWVPLLLLLISIYVFWILPQQMPAPKIKATFESPTAPANSK